jgi:hypothetical protein
VLARVGGNARVRDDRRKRGIDLARPRTLVGELRIPEGSFLSIDPSGPGVLKVPANFAQSGVQSSTLGGAVQMFSANSPHWSNGTNNPGANTASFTGVSNPLGLSNNNAFGRLWPSNAPFGDAGVGSSSILDPTGLPLKGAPSPVIGGVYVGSLTNRNVVAAPHQPQVIEGSLSTGAVGTAFLGPSPDSASNNTCRAVFSVVTADGENTMLVVSSIRVPNAHDNLQRKKLGPTAGMGS